MGRVNDSRNNRKLTISGTSFIVIYRIEKTEIQILRILHCARNLENIFEMEVNLT